jgi:hypothetical protein
MSGCAVTMNKRTAAEETASYQDVRTCPLVGQDNLIPPAFRDCRLAVFYSSMHSLQNFLERSI